MRRRAGLLGYDGPTALPAPASFTVLAAALPLFQTANELTLYESADVTYQLYLHPLLPDDEACPGF